MAPGFFCSPVALFARVVTLFAICCYVVGGFFFLPSLLFFGAVLHGMEILHEMLLVAISLWNQPRKNASGSRNKFFFPKWLLDSDRNHFWSSPSVSLISFLSSSFRSVSITLLFITPFWNRLFSHTACSSKKRCSVSHCFTYSIECAP